jgi:hypothetical protein
MSDIAPAVPAPPTTPEEIHAENARSLRKVKGRIASLVAANTPTDNPVLGRFRHNARAIELLDSLEPPVDATLVFEEGFEVEGPDHAATITYRQMVFDPDGRPAITYSRERVYDTITRPLTPEQAAKYRTVSP